MKLFVQQGYGKGNKIETALNRNTVDGVILSPRDDTESNIMSFSRLLIDNYSAQSEVLFDPQFYYSTYQNSTAKNLNNLSYYPGPLDLRSFRSTKDLNKFASDTLLYQIPLNTSYLLSPTIIINSFSDRKTQIALNLSQECINVVQDQGLTTPLLVSLIFEESALNETDYVDDFLNEISVLPVDGFYITVARSHTDYSQDFNSELGLSNLLTIIYSLSEINEYKVIMGYSDIIGLLFLAAGAYGIATGWHNGSRKFTIQQRVLPSKGGRTPRERYCSIPLLNSILLSELDSIYQNTQMQTFQSVLSGTQLEDSIILSGQNPSEGWTRYHSHQQHWAGIKKAIDEMSMHTQDPTTRFDYLENKISQAKTLYGILSQNAVQLERSSLGSHLDKWEQSIDLFRAKANI